MKVILALIISFSISETTCLDLDFFYQYLNISEHSSASCKTQRDVFLAALEKQEMWALRMVDSYGRIPQAITQGNALDLGTYDQCVSINEQVNSVEIQGKYCSYGLAIPLSNTGLQSFNSQNKHDNLQLYRGTDTRNDNETVSTTLVFLAACVPAACLPSDLFGTIGIDAFCQVKSENKSLDTADICCLVFLAVAFSLIVLSTAYDIYLHKSSKETPHAMLLAFSTYTNGKKILQTHQQSGQILFLNGLKVISMFWVILFHRFGYLSSTTINASDYNEWSQRWYAAYYWVGHLAVDTFFYIGGVLVSYNFFKRQSKFNIIMFYLHRYLRLTPPLLAFFFVHMTLVRRIASGPMYSTLIEAFNEPCKDNWWALFLYIQNYAVPDRMCFTHTWYISVDMQFFILSPLVLLSVAWFGRKMAYFGIPILVVITTAYLIPIFYSYDFIIFSNDYYQIYYATTHSRFAPWLLGMMLGVFIVDYHKEKEKYQIKNQLLIGAIWTAIAALMAFLIFYQNEVDFNRTTTKAALFYPMQKTLWGVCLCWISYACLTDNAFFTNWFLSLPVFQVLSKVTYSTYLIHFTLILMHAGYSRTRFYFNDYEAFRVIVADIFITYLIGSLWTLAFESPFVVLEQLAFGRKAAKEDEKGKPFDSYRNNAD